jgi:hypothetical protein
MKDELDLETTVSAEETKPATPFSFRFLDEETLQILLDDKIATGG